jgi:Nif-specific regulatory protein
MASRKPAVAAVERLVDEERLLYREVAKRLGRSLEPERAMREMLHLMSELLGLNRGRVLLPDDSGALRIRVAYGLTREEMTRGRYAAGEGVTGRVYASGEAEIVQDVDAEPGYLARAVRRATLPPQTVAFLAVPIPGERKPAGVLAVHRLRQRVRPLADDLEVLRTMATLIGQLLRLQRLIAQRTADLEHENRALKDALAQTPSTVAAHGIVGQSAALKQALRQLERVAGTDATVLLLGESGTGKELFARALHLASPRRDGPFVKVNCAAIPDTLFEAELFGYEKGAFTGAASARAGRFEQADGGTLFLDEIGDLPLALQAKLLRALQERSIERLGARRETPVDLRIVAATHRDLQQLAASGTFRADLLYRINVIPLELPPLRERHEDLRLLIAHHLQRLEQQYQRNTRIEADALALLLAYPWPGNIRQLVNVLERLVLLCEGERIDAALVRSALGSETAELPAAASAAADAAEPALRPYQRVVSGDRARIEAALARQGGNRTRAAASLGLTVRQLTYRMRQLGCG